MRDLETQWFEMKLIDEQYIKTVHQRKDSVELLQELQETVKATIATTSWYYGLQNQALVDYERDPVGEASFTGLFLNNFNTFLYMANYYVIVPTANEYASALGLTKTLSGALLAMAPLASMVSSIIYSIWSNRSFKQPLLFCTLLLFAGNFAYAAALSYKSVSMLFVGRLLVGLGGNRAVNRRYISDFVPIDQRTFLSAIFVAVGSLGMTVGPGSQPLFNLIDWRIPGFGWIVNGLTAPGWIMCLLWAVFFFQVLLQFTEPERRYARALTASQLEPLLSPSETDEFALASAGSFHMPVDADGTVVCLWVYFVLKLAQEAFQGAAPLVTEYFFSWTDATVGYLLAAIGLVVLPVNFFVGWMSSKFHDRQLQNLSLALLGVGAAMTVIFSPERFGVKTYVCGTMLLYISAQVLEAVNMGLLSKVMPKVMSRGLWNSGFLSTEAGTAGRVTGNVMISVAGAIGGVVALQNLIVLPCLLLVIGTFVVICWKYDSLAPLSERLPTENEADQILESEVWSKLPEIRPLRIRARGDRQATLSSSRLTGVASSYVTLAHGIGPARTLRLSTGDVAGVSLVEPRPAGEEEAA
eukprot:Polyplicarium_translucidae@DN270_c0_g1_i1.p1